MKNTLTLIAALSASMAFASPDDVTLQDWDSNGDGLLSREEAAEIQYHMFDSFDLNEDGDLRGREREAFEQLRAFRQAENPLFATLGSPDVNGDMLISAGEFQAWTNRLFDRLDLSGDGALNEQEMLAQKP